MQYTRFYNNYEYFSDTFFDPSRATIYDCIYFFFRADNGSSYTYLCSVLICIIFWGFFGIFFMRSNYILIMISLEIAFLGLGLFFCFISLFRGNSEGFLFAIIIQTVAAGEAALGLSLLISLNSKGISSQLDKNKKDYAHFMSNFFFFFLLEDFFELFFIYILFFFFNNKIFFWKHYNFFWYLLILYSFFIFLFNWYIYKKVLFLEEYDCLWLFKNNFIILVDSFSIYFFFLTTFIIFVCFLLTRYLTSNYEEQFFVFCFLHLSQIILLIGFITDNILIFWVCFELIVVPLIYFIYRWGSRSRKELATVYLLLYTLFGGIVFLIGIAHIYNLTETFSLNILMHFLFSFNDQRFLWWLFFITFAIKIPLVPFHLWLPEAHVEASTIGSMILAGLVLKLGGYGFLRFATVLCPEAHAYYINIVLFWSLYSAILAGVFALRQIDLKKLVAYASVAHMSMGAAALFIYNTKSVTGAVLLMISHSFTASSLFMAIGFIYLRYGYKYYGYYTGWFLNMPYFSFFLFCIFLANISFPGTLTFVAELFVILGFFQSHYFSAIFLILLFISLFINVAYILLFFTRLVGGVPQYKVLTYFRDVTIIEFISFVLLIFPIFYFGFFPNMLLNYFNTDFAQYNYMLENKLLYW